MTGGGINVRNSGRNELQPADTLLLVFSPPTLLFNLDWNKKKLELLPCCLVDMLSVECRRMSSVVELLQALVKPEECVAWS